MLAIYVDYPSWIDPFVIDALPVRWYAVMYLVAFFIAYLLFRYQCRNDGVIEMSADESQSFFFCGILGLLIFARLFSVLFYSDASYYLTHPWMIFWPFRDGKFVGLPGMSYHGGIVGALLGGAVYCRIHHRSLMKITDITTAGIPLGYTFGRLGNFINAELYGRVTAVPWGMVFPTAPGFSSENEWVRNIADRVGMSYQIGDVLNLPRHPSQLYEALFEGIVLFLILWFVIRPWKLRRSLPDGTVFSFYLMGYGLFRFFIEYCRQPDADIGYVLALGSESDNIALFQSFLNISKGQVFCFLMILSGAVLLAVLLAVRHGSKGKEDCNDRKDRGKSRGSAGRAEGKRT